MKKVAYYKGCLAALSAKELDSSTKALAPKQQKTFINDLKTKLDASVRGSTSVSSSFGRQIAKDAILSGPQERHISRGDDPPYPPMSAWRRTEGGRVRRWGPARPTECEAQAIAY